MCYCRSTARHHFVGVVVLFVFVLAGRAQGELYINEIYFDPPQATGDDTEEYVELRGTPGMSLDNHYLLFIENEDNVTHTGGAGLIDSYFDLNGQTIGGNGYLTLRQKDSPYAVAAGTTDVVNTLFGDGFGSTPPSSSVGFWDNGFDGQIENSGFTAMLIHSDGELRPPNTALPFTFDMDNGNNGLDDETTDTLNWRDHWTILDSIGNHGEDDEPENGRLYAQINFGNGPTDPSQLEPDAVYVDVGFEIEYLARWGNSTGQTEHDWHIANLSDRDEAGYVGPDDFRQSVPDPHPDSSTDPIGVDQRTESSQWVPYRTNLTNTLGADNYPLNLEFLPWDYNQNGVVDAADYTVWRDSLGETGAGLAADADLDQVVDEQDYLAWKYHFGESLASLAGSGATALATASHGPVSIPEPTTLAMLMFGALAAFGMRRLCYVDTHRTGNRSQAN